METARTFGNHLWYIVLPNDPPVPLSTVVGSMTLPASRFLNMYCTPPVIWNNIWWVQSITIGLGTPTYLRTGTSPDLRLTIGYGAGERDSGPVPKHTNKVRRVSVVFVLCCACLDKLHPCQKLVVDERELCAWPCWWRVVALASELQS